MTKREIISGDYMVLEKTATCVIQSGQIIGEMWCREKQQTVTFYKIGDAKYLCHCRDGICDKCFREKKIPTGEDTNRRRREVNTIKIIHFGMMGIVVSVIFLVWYYGYDVIPVLVLGIMCFVAFLSWYYDVKD